MHFTQTSVKKILRLPVVKELTGYSSSTIYLNMSKGTFPKQIILGAKSVGWLESDISDWIEQKIRASTTQLVKSDENITSF